MIRVSEITKQDRLSVKILNGITGIVIVARKGMSYDDIIKNGLNNDTLMGIIDFGIGEGAFMPSYKIKDWIANVKEFFDNPPPQNILVAVYKELQKYPQGSIKGHK
jgi:hypothetical protein